MRHSVFGESAHCAGDNTAGIWSGRQHRSNLQRQTKECNHNAPPHQCQQDHGQIASPLGYATFGCAMLLLSLRSEPIAWQVAISMSFITAIVDLPAPRR